MARRTKSELAQSEPRTKRPRKTPMAEQRTTTYQSRKPQQYNSSNAPQHFNNTPVAMDMSADRNRRDRRWNPRVNRGSQANVANAERPFKGKCFNCEREGHIARDCMAPKRSIRKNYSYGRITNNIYMSGRNFVFL